MTKYQIYSIKNQINEALIEDGKVPSENSTQFNKQANYHFFTLLNDMSKEDFEKTVISESKVSKEKDFRKLLQFIKTVIDSTKESFDKEESDDSSEEEKVDPQKE